MYKCDNWFIYALIDPRDQRVRYIGFTGTTIEKRLKGHINEARERREGKYKFEYHRCRWIRQLLALNLRPHTLQLENGQGLSWKEAEKRWIAHFRQAGAPLTNLTEGGEGTVGVKRSAEYKENCRKRMLGNTRCHLATPINKALNTGKKRSAETRAKISASGKLRTYTDEQCAKMRIAKPGKKLSDQDLRDIRASRGVITRKALAEKYGVSKPAIDAVLAGTVGRFVK